MTPGPAGRDACDRLLDRALAEDHRRRWAERVAAGTPDTLAEETLVEMFKWRQQDESQ